MSKDYDVIIVGGGGAGLVAALTAAEHGASVLVVEAGAHCGGSTALSGGVVYAAATSVQAACGVTDSVDAMYRYHMTLNQWRLNPGLIHQICEHSGPTVEWLIGLGVQFPTERLYAAGLDGIKRGHRASGMGKEIVATLEYQVNKRPQMDVAKNTRVDALLLSDGCVSGIRAGNEQVSANAVIIASGGFGANREMIARYLPATARYGEWLWYVGSPLSRGDGLRMGCSVGAELTGYDCVTPLLTPGFNRDFEPYLPGWFLFVSHAGVRFADETIDYSVSGGMVRELPGGECFAIFDEDARHGKPVNRAKGGMAYVASSWTPQMLTRMIDSKQILAAESLELLAERAGINFLPFRSCVENYNGDCDLGVDREFFKDAGLMRPIRTPPFYAVRIRPAVVGITGAGLRIDRTAAVMNSDGLAIGGLFAAGETVGGVMGSCYVGGGGALTNAFTLGRISGRSAAAHATNEVRSMTPTS